MVKRRGTDVVTALGQDAPEHGRRPAADVLFRSVAETYRAHGLGLVLTGMGEDALLGSQRIAGAGGRIVVQDEATSTVWEMAGRIVAAGLSDAVLPIGDMAADLLRRTTSGGLRTLPLLRAAVPATSTNGVGAGEVNAQSEHAGFG